MHVSPGDVAPDFTLDGPGGAWTLSAHRGKPVAIYFYPKDGTAGCTTQACNVRDNWAALDAAGAVIVGVSPDDGNSHAAFTAEHDLPQVLLSDPDHEVMRQYGAWRTKVKDGQAREGVVRSSVVVAPDGRVAAVLDPIDPQDQAAAVLSVLAGQRWPTR